MSTTSAAGRQHPTFEGVGSFLKRYSDWALGIGVLALMVVLLTPVSPIVLDGMLASSLAGALLLLLVTMNVKGSSELSTFPTILLFATLFRLGLNVASTRLILTEGKAGGIITAFGRYVIGDNLTVGLVIFLILIIIQFVVITKGAGRISEVAARFVLDAMPGKQMAIDADLNAGLIEQDEARERREKIAKEAEFYGAMDGASKFVRGDAIAGLIITALNLLGGMAIGAAGALSIGEAAQKYSMLTVGDGLVSQIPALLISTASAILVTKATGEQSLGESLAAQVGGRPKATLIAAGMMFTIGLLPGMPMLPFGVLATMLLLTWRSTRGAEGGDDLLGIARKKPARAGADSPAGELAAGADKPDETLALLQVDRVALEIGYRLIPFVQDKNGAGILDHISQLRKRFAGRDGIVLPPVRIKDNIRLAPSAYRILVGGQEVGRGELEPGHHLAMDGGGATAKLRGKKTVDPAFGLPAVWISEAERDEAELAGYTVIDPTSVLVTHLSEVLRASFPEILNRDDVKELIENAKQTSATVVEELIPDKMGYGDVQKVLRNLISEGVPIRNMPAILETLADHAGRTKDAETLTELVRQRLGRVLCEQYADAGGTLHAVTLDPAVESRLAAAVGTGHDPEASPVSPAVLQALVERLGDTIAQAARGGAEIVVLVRSNVRRFMTELVRASLPKVAVLSYNEVVPARAVETAAVVKLED
jgi:flagellar biosynthesis protein FlhA